MTNDNQRQNNQENTQKSPENKDNLENPQEQNTVQVPEVEQKELKTSVSTETESAEIMSEKPNTEPLTKTTEEKPTLAEPKLTGVTAENKTANTSETEIKTEVKESTKSEPVVTASPEIEIKTETPTEVISETKEKIETKPEIKEQVKQETPIQTPTQEITPSPIETPKEEVEATPSPQESQIKPKPIQQTKIVEKIIYKTDPNIIQKLLTKARAKIQERKRKKLDKIMTLFEMKSQIISADVQKLLRTPKRTTTRYLDHLENEGKIIQVGKKGKGVLYIKKP